MLVWPSWEGTSLVRRYEVGSTPITSSDVSVLT